MLFRKDIKPRCGYCAHGSQLDESQVICIKRGIVSPEHHCRAFSYDPLRRTPPPPATLPKVEWKEEDFSIE